MKIRQKITLWISLTTLIAAVSFSSFVFLEMLEQPYYLIDTELKHMAEAMYGQYRNNLDQPLTFDEKSLPNPPDHYWIRLSDSSGAILYASSLTRFTEIPLSQSKRSYNVEKVIPRELIQLDQDDHDEVAFRVRIARANINNADYTLMIAKPIEELEEEMIELFHELGAILSTCFIIGVLFSYNLAGRILQPIVTINQLVREISEKSLDKRIPLGKSKDELYTLSVSLNQMFDRLQNSFIRQKDYLASASHELKSPIALLLLSQEEMLRSPDLPDNLREDLASQHNSLQRMNRLIRNLLDLSRLEHQTALNLEQVNLAELTDEVLEDYREVLSASLISLESYFDRELYVQGDQERLRRMLINLIDNAIRYNRKTGGQLRIEGQRELNAVKLMVANTGPHVAQEDIARIFEQFYRVEKSRSTQFGGSGLGLAIAKRIVELHRGEICFTSREDGWNTITVNLPVEESEG